jgi:hypothetical protein
MALTLADLRTMVLRYGFDTSDPVDKTLNSVMYDIMDYHDWDWMYGRVTNVSMSSTDSAAQNLPADLFKVSTLRDATRGFKLMELSPQEWARRISDPSIRGAPEFYSVISSELFIYPLAVTDTVFDLLYQRLIGPMALDADQPAGGFMPERLRYLMVPGAAAKLLQMENEEDRSTVARAEYTDGLESAIRRDVSDLDSFRTVLDTQGYY